MTPEQPRFDASLTRYRPTEGMAAVKSIWTRLRRALRSSSEAERGDAPGKYLPSEEFFDARTRALGPDGYYRVDVDRQFKKP